MYHELRVSSNRMKEEQTEHTGTRGQWAPLPIPGSGSLPVGDVPKTPSSFISVHRLGQKSQFAKKLSSTGCERFGRESRRWRSRTVLRVIIPRERRAGHSDLNPRRRRRHERLSLLRCCMYRRCCIIVCRRVGGGVKVTSDRMDY